MHTERIACIMRTVTTQKVIEDKERQTKAVQLRAAGLSFDVIAAQLGFANRQSAHRSVKAALQGNLREAVAELRELDAERLDGLLRALYPRALKGDYGAADRVLRILERRAKLYGLDAPVKQEVSGPEGGPMGVQVFAHGNVTAAIASRSSDYHLPSGED